MKDKKAAIFYFLMTLILLDFGSQLRKLSFFEEIDSINNPLFSICHIQNTGSAFGMFENQALFLAFLGIVVIALLSYYVLTSVQFKDRWLLLSITLFSAGTLGNIVERIRYHAVIDYIKLNFIDFPVFNSFDIMICLGIFIYFIFVLISSKKVKNEN